MKTNGEAQQADIELVRRVESGRSIVKAAMGTCVASLVAIAGFAIHGENAKHAAYALGPAIPLLGIYLIVTSPGHERRYDVSTLMQWTTVLGLVATVVGMSFLFEEAATGVGIMFGVSALLCGFICVQSQDRAFAKLKRPAQNSVKT